MTKFCPCGRVEFKDGFCKRHIKNPPKPKREKQPKFRGASKFQIEMGYGITTTGSNA